MIEIHLPSINPALYGSHILLIEWQINKILLTRFSDQYDYEAAAFPKKVFRSMVQIYPP